MVGIDLQRDFLPNMAITAADPALVVEFKSMAKWPLPCEMVFVLASSEDTTWSSVDITSKTVLVTPAQSKRPSLASEKHRIFGKETETKNCET